MGYRRNLKLVLVRVRVGRRIDGREEIEEKERKEVRDTTHGMLNFLL